MPKTSDITNSTSFTPEQTASPKLNSFAPEQDNRVTSQSYYSKCYDSLAIFLGGAEPAQFLYRIHYWLQNAKSGYRLLDGSKWIFNGYKEWQEQISWLSVGQIGSMVRRLEALGWIITDRYHNLKGSIGFAQRTPSFHEDNQRKWYRIDYEKIYQDTGFDLLFDSVDQSAPPKQMAETLENSQSRNFKISISKFQDSSIYKENTKALSRESEKQGMNLDNVNTEVSEVEVNHDSPSPSNENEGWQDKSVDPGKDQSSAAPRNKTLKIVKCNPMTHARPARLDPKLRYPDGPWLTETGCLNADFVSDRANLWRTGDTPASQAFGRMPIEEVMALVACYYGKPQNQANLEIHWAAYVAKNQRYFSNVKQRLDAGISIPQREQEQVLAKLPAVLATPVQPVYEYESVTDLSILPSLELPKLTASKVLRDGVENWAPEGAENWKSYQDNVDPEQVEWMKRFLPSAVQAKAKKRKPIIDEL